MQMFSDINQTNVFLGQPPKTIETKATKKKRGGGGWLIKLTVFLCTAKEIINKMKRQPID